jgi:uncharacterized membrane protein YecN with MAPEG domain
MYVLNVYVPNTWYIINMALENKKEFLLRTFCNMLRNVIFIIILILVCEMYCVYVWLIFIIGIILFASDLLNCNAMIHTYFP